MTDEFEDRLVADTYREDVVVAVRLEPDPRDESAEGIERWVSERLVARLGHLGSAYELPLLSRLNGETSYPQVQLLSLEDELAFLFGVLTDPVFAMAAAPFRELIGHAAHHPRGWSLVVEGP